MGFFGAVTETHDTSPLGLRLKVVRGAIAQAEVVVVRAADSGLKFRGPVFQHKAVLNEIVPQDARCSRERMIEIADGYFDTLQRNDGTLHTRFWDTCTGSRTASRPPTTPS